MKMKLYIGVSGWENNAIILKETNRLKRHLLI